MPAGPPPPMPSATAGASLSRVHAPFASSPPDVSLFVRAGGQRLVAAMEAVDALIGTFTDDFGRAVAHGAPRHAVTRALCSLLARCRVALTSRGAVRAEVGRERDAALGIVDAARVELEQVRAGAAAASPRGIVNAFHAAEPAARAGPRRAVGGARALRGAAAERARRAGPRVAGASRQRAPSRFFAAPRCVVAPHCAQSAMRTSRALR